MNTLTLISQYFLCKVSQSEIIGLCNYQIAFQENGVSLYSHSNIQEKASPLILEAVIFSVNIFVVDIID